jgi:anaerobic nitric oxide reductase flavorubredoxin
MVVELKKGVYNVGVVDWGNRFFHGYELSTERGTSYNSYLIIDEKKVLIDTVLEPFKDELIENIRQIIDPSEIDIVVANHSEFDHAGSLPLIMHHTPNASLIVSKRGMDSFQGNYHNNWNMTSVKTGDSINIGKNNLVFIEAPCFIGRIVCLHI